MSSNNVDRLREAYDAYNREGVEGILAYLDPEVDWRNPPESADADVFVGHAGVLEWQRMVPFTEMHFEPHLVEIRDGKATAFTI